MRSFLNRLERLRAQTGGNWAEIAKMIGVSRTTLHLIRRGEHELNQRMLLLLEQAEINAGLRRRPGDKEGILKLLEAVPMEDLGIGESEHDAGFVEVEVEFRRGSIPGGFTNRIPVRAPNASIAAQLLVDLLINEDYEGYLRHCLPPEYATKAFLNRLEPVSFLRLLNAALEMSLGVGWRDRLPRLARRLENYIEPENG